ncbi:helix-turn-helix domain-containing protein [Edaphobacter sp. 12200R-103]|uniref:helix-turn-helix domain-containing protein n=1 Tax=Edaphobacter sp. 12200R-103 TaxID=2703788 RepID=UPI001EE48357|nr:helix-turn-helix domain-containing protein [Edaphobacter sp. 12200R-103]
MTTSQARLNFLPQRFRSTKSISRRQDALFAGIVRVLSEIMQSQGENDRQTGFHSVKYKSKKMKRDPVEKTPDYSIRSVVRACDILKCFRQDGAPLSLNDVAERTELSRPTAYRLLKTLVSCGMLDSPAKNAYFLAAWHRKGRRFRFGYASQSEEFSFSRLVSESIRSSAYDAGVDLLVLNNCYSPKTAVRNAEIFVREQVDLVIEFQTNQQSASVVASKLMEAGIPIIAIEIPHPGAAYYGANNYRAGLIGGHALARACMREWNGAVDEVLLLELPMAGPLPRSRLTGMLAGLREHLQKLPFGSSTVTGVLRRAWRLCDVICDGPTRATFL